MAGLLSVVAVLGVPTAGDAEMSNVEVLRAHEDDVDALTIA